MIDIPPYERLIVALDVPSLSQACALVETLGSTVCFYKVGLQLLTTREGFEFIDWLAEHEKKVFVDLKLFDIPETVAAAVRQLRQYPITFTTVHGNDAMLDAAVQEKGHMKILAVTALTSLDTHDMHDLGFEADIRSLVCARAARALQLGCDGIVSSGLEARDVHQDLQDRVLIVTPGIRPGINTDDGQKRVVDLNTAFELGADYIVVGRPILTASHPKGAAQHMQAKIQSLFGATLSRVF